MTCSLQATESAHSWQKTDGQFHQKHRDLRSIRAVTHWRPSCFGDGTFNPPPDPPQNKHHLDIAGH